MDSPAATGHRTANLVFRHRGLPGVIYVACVPELDPATRGKPEYTRGFPVCTAKLEFDGTGYDAFFGWVQFVRSSDNSTGGKGFDLDPLAWFPDAPSPYAFFGHLPDLFDAPSRETRQKISWLAHSFLCVTPPYDSRTEVLHLRKVQPV